VARLSVNMGFVVASGFHNDCAGSRHGIVSNPITTNRAASA